MLGLSSIDKLLLNNKSNSSLEGIVYRFHWLLREIRLHLIASTRNVLLRILEQREQEPISQSMYVRSVVWRRESIFGYLFLQPSKDVDGNAVVVDCHTVYHVEKKLYTSPPPVLTTESSVVSDLTNE